MHRWPGTDNPARPVLHAPPGARETFRRVVGAWGNEDLIENAFDLREYDAAERARDRRRSGSRFQPVPHFTETFAMCLTSTNGGGRLVYGADCRPTEALVEFAKDADLLLIEATLPRPERTGVRGHLTPAEAGEHARGRAAPSGSCSCTSRTSSTPSGRATRPAQAFDGPVEVAARALSTRSERTSCRPILVSVAR